MPSKQAIIAVSCIGALLFLSACSGSKEVQDEPVSVAQPPPAADRTREEDAPKAPSKPPERLPATATVEQFVQDALRSAGAVSYRELVRRLGAPQRVDEEPVPNPYDVESVDTLRTLYYDGLHAAIYDVTSEAKSFLIRIALTDRRFTSPEGLRVGDPQQRVLEQVGPPTERGGSGQFIYQEDTSMPTAMIITVRNGRVAQIEWEFYFS